MFALPSVFVVLYFPPMFVQFLANIFRWFSFDFVLDLRVSGG